MVDKIPSTRAKVHALSESCERMRMGGQETPWSAVLGDVSAFGTSLRLLRDAVPNNFSSQVLLPKDHALDYETIRNIPDLLYTHPGDDAYATAQDNINRYKEIYGRSINNMEELQERRRQIAKFNNSIDRLTDELLQTSQKLQSEKPIYRAPPQTTHYQIQQEYDKLAKAIHLLTDGTALDPYLKGPRK